MEAKKSVQTLKSYRTKAIPWSVKLDANEATVHLLEGFKKTLPNALNRYPDNHATALRNAASSYYGVPTKNMIAGNGSSEMLELIFKTYLEAGEKVLSFEPSFTMYRVFTEIYNGEYVPLNTKAPFDFDVDRIIKEAQKIKPKIIILCSPNNPTGSVFKPAEIKKVIQNTQALIVVDEAYIEFYDPKQSMLKYLDTFDRLIVLRSLSKAFGLAGIRLGFLLANQALISTMKAVKSPYNLNVLTQAVGQYALSQLDIIHEHLIRIKTERDEMITKLQSLNLEVWPSKGNFIFFKSKQKDLYEKLVDRGLLIRKFSAPLQDYYRLSLGDKKDNERCFNTLKEVTKDA